MRELPGDVTLELRAGDAPAVALVQGENRVRVELAHVRELVPLGAWTAEDWMD